MAITYRALSRLLSYPDAVLQAEADSLVDAMQAEGIIPERIIKSLRKLALSLASMDIYEAQAMYVDQFDRSRTLSLHLYEHVHGESRERGPAMVGLVELYKSHGLELNVSDLPDYLPIFLEFLSIIPDADAASLIGEAAHVIEAIGERLKKRQSPYRAIFGALMTLSDRPADKDALADLLAIPEDDPDDLEALDENWAEAPVTFGPGTPSDGCPKAAAMVGNMQGARG
ncbi:MAG: nitrate reductase [Hyphomonas sp. BRH_c22]|uniref:nitrate reductase molybdenum cofactor assembly chaperone n=1 Tax=Hyphomonas sp. BRH_c22 TaxID=1629710 RepID=UPI0005F160C8|nr:nitrate reductase molybdenum cofactor assembly chaperone [Hyphomonas sp. BRH_c22]KJS37436.1 MAG: nitrate reductase [Hyphomonas sp. BRH_c22]